MNPTNDSNQPVNPTPVLTPPASPAPEKIGNPVQKTDKKFLFYGVLIGLVVVAIVGVAGFYMMYAPKSSSDVAVVSTPVQVENMEPTPVEISQIEQASELDNLIVGLAQADGDLDKELAALGKDSDF
ncbi:MAG: hypothetical protein KBD51_02485 [Candidatus Levybacteria bacterium]|nr:hypothetical protein [Candidatus Levybacteria bacterium]